MQTLRKRIPSTRRSRRRQRLRVADSMLIAGLIAAWATSGAPVLIHALVSLVFTAALIGHGWLHRTWYRALARRFSPSRSLRVRSAAGVNTLILLISTLVVVLGIIAWLGPRGVKGIHGGISYALLGLASAHLLLNVRQGLALVRKRRDRPVPISPEVPLNEELPQAA